MRDEGGNQQKTRPSAAGPQPLRTGYTTGACAAAAARAATRALVTGRPVTEVTIDLPARKGVSFAVCRCDIEPGRVTCGVIKDAGDDPDVTHGAEIQATVEWCDGAGLVLANGAGVGRVTRPGLAVEVGQPAINPTPRRMITQAVLAESETALGRRGLRVTISAPNGEALARQTLNPRLGIVGGISILGTTGIVRPFSRSAYRGSIYVELKVAAHNGVPRAVLATGHRSEEYTRQRHPDWPELGFVQVGDHMDYALKQVRRLGLPQVVIAGMIGKISKLAQGRMQTHISAGEVDFDFLAATAGRLGADAELQERVRAANTARHVQILLRQAGVSGLEAWLAQTAAEQAFAFVEGALTVEVLLYDIRGELLAVGGRK
ncbi:MAG: cobalt-precorrin-5B (C(1))-methyltransferase [Chloroflexota bacterium]